MPPKSHSTQPAAARPVKGRRGGAVTVEFALVVSVFILLLFGGIEFARINMLRHTLESAAYEGAREGIVAGATSNECETAAQLALDNSGVKSATITVTPTTIVDETEEVTVEIEIPMSGNGFIAPQFFFGSTLRSEITLSRDVY